MSTSIPWAEVISGKITSITRWSDTHIFSHGGGGFVSKDGGHVAAPQVESTSIQRTELFLTTDNGLEIKLDLSGYNVSFREGSKIIAIRGGERGEKVSSFFYIENVETGETYSSVNRLVATIPDSTGFGTGIAAFLLSWILSYYLFEISRVDNPLDISGWLATTIGIVVWIYIRFKDGLNNSQPDGVGS